MTHVKIGRSKEPIRLFESDFLEFFTHVHPVYHHTQTPGRRFGVSSPLWDIVFGTEE